MLALVCASSSSLPREALKAVRSRSVTPDYPDILRPIIFRLIWRSWETPSARWMYPMHSLTSWGTQQESFNSTALYQQTCQLLSFLVACRVSQWAEQQETGWQSRAYGWQAEGLATATQ